MFGELPKIFDRNFVVAYFIPASIFVLGSFGLYVVTGSFRSSTFYLREDPLIGATWLGVCAWLLGILLMVLNFSLYRFFEGYGKLNPLRAFVGLENRRFDRMQSEINRLVREIKECNNYQEDEDIILELRSQRRQLLQTRVEEFPLDVGRILPTRFGNAIRAFEDYATDMYGVDSIVVWVRLLAVLPKDYREMIDTAKAQVDFWLNLRLLGVLFFIEYLVLGLFPFKLSWVWIPILTGTVLTFSLRNATLAAIHWGDYVKASFDLYLPLLHAKLLLPTSTTIDLEREHWKRFSQMVLYHQTEKAFNRILKASFREGSSMPDTEGTS